MKLVCNVCGSTLHHERVDDGYAINKIDENGDVTELASKSDGYDRVFCSKSNEHVISSEITEQVLDIVQG